MFGFCNKPAILVDPYRLGEKCFAVDLKVREFVNLRGNGLRTVPAELASVCALIIAEWNIAPRDDQGPGPQARWLVRRG